MTENIITDPKQVQAKMIALHRELGNFQIYLARQTKPPRWEGPEQESLKEVAILLEREIERLGNHIKNVNLDSLVEGSLRAAGFKPDEEQP